MTKDLESWELDLIKDKFLKDINNNFSELLPKVFPHEGRVVRISGEELCIEVSDHRYKSAIYSMSKTLIAMLNDIGLNKINRIKVKSSKNFIRTKPMKGILDIVASKSPHIKKNIDNNENEKKAVFAHAKAILEKAERLHKFNKLFSDTFGPPFPNQAQIVNVKDGVISITATSSVHATKVRLLTKEIIETCITLGIKSVNNVQIRVSSQSSFNPLDVEKPTPNNNKIMSEAAAKALNSAAEYIEDDGLSFALKKLAEKHKKIINWHAGKDSNLQ